MIICEEDSVRKNTFVYSAVKLLNFAGFTEKSPDFFTDSVSRMNDGSLRGIKFKNRLKP